METAQVKETATSAVLFVGPCKVTFTLGNYDNKDQNTVDIILYDNATEAAGKVIDRMRYDASMEGPSVFHPFEHQIDCKNGVYAVVPGVVTTLLVGIGLE